MNILITGASSGIGATVAKYLSEKGHRLILTARSEERLQSLADQIGMNAYIYPFDLLQLEKAEEVFKFLSAKGLKLDGFVHCAGINRDIPIGANDILDMHEVMNTNALSFIELSKYFIKKKYSNNNSSIIAISSISVSFPKPGMCTYTMSKAALNTAVKVMAKEVLARGIRVNSISPAFVRTEMVEQTKNSIVDFRIDQPFGIIEPIYIAYMVDFLLSEKAKYITGTDVPINAGLI